MRGLAWGRFPLFADEHRPGHTFNHLKMGTDPKLLKVVIFVLCLVPLAKLVAETFGLWGLSLGANPVEEILHRCGRWGLNFLVITLSVTPLRRVTGWNQAMRFRRMLGLFAFFYIMLHFLIYAGLDQRFAIGFIAEDIAERPYITLGITALILLIPLAITSTNGMMRRLGRRWQKLHRLVYPIAVLGVVHFWWQVKADILEPMIYAGILALLFAIRLYYYLKRKRKERALSMKRDIGTETA